uniref:Uncharacterized protein n=1 Tax=Oryza sativa subsp. japonica TaxID=39947 RepID=Q6ZB35_ORYSJ|nr:hypothetical protein [Oryza sativa Japonica Group]
MTRAQRVTGAHGAQLRCRVALCIGATPTKRRAAETRARAGRQDSAPRGAAPWEDVARGTNHRAGIISQVKKLFSQRILLLHICYGP